MFRVKRSTRYLLHVVGKRIRKNKCVKFKCTEVETHVFLYVKDVCPWNKSPEEIKPAPSVCIFLNKSQCYSEKHYSAHELQLYVII